MPTNTNLFTQAEGVVNRAQGHFVTTSATAAAQVFNVGFVPRIVRVHNVTDRISDEWYKGIDEAALFAALNGINAKLDADAGVTPTDFAATCNPAGATLAQLETAIELLTAKLDGAGGVTDTNFAALFNITVPPTAALLKASVNGINAKLDADAGVTDTNFAATWNVTNVALHTVAAGTRTFDMSLGITVGEDGTFTLPAGLMIASKSFVWEAIG